MFLVVLGLGLAGVLVFYAWGRGRGRGGAAGSFQYSVLNLGREEETGLLPAQAADSDSSDVELLGDLTGPHSPIQFLHTPHQVYSLVI